MRTTIGFLYKLQIYKAAVLLYLTYCHLMWHFCRVSETRWLARIQERALRAIYCYEHLQSTVSSVRFRLLNASNSWKKLNLVCKFSSTGKFRSPSQKRIIYFDFWEVCIHYSLVKVIFLRFLGITLFTFALYRMHLIHLCCVCRIFLFEFIFESGIHQLGKYYV